MIRKLAALVLILTTGLGLTIAIPAPAPVSGGGGYYTSPTDSYYGGSGSTDTSTDTQDSTESDFQTGTDTNDDGSTEQDFQSDPTSDTDTTTPDQNDDGTTDSTQEDDTTTSDSSSDTDSTESDFQTGNDSNDDGSSEDDFQDGSSDQNDDGSSEDDFDTGGDQNDDGTSEDDFSNSAPTAAISYSPQNPTPGEAVSFDGSSSSDSDGSIESYTWSGAFEATGETAEHSFSEEGSYTVELTVTDNDGRTDSSTVTVTVEKKETPDDDNGDDDSDNEDNDEDDKQDDNKKPTADFNYSPENPTTGGNVEFDASSSSDEDGTVESYSWDFDNDGSFEADGKEQSTEFDTSGTKIITLNVEDNDGATDSISKSIEVQKKEDGGGDDDDEDGDGDNEDNNEEDDDSSGGGETSDFEWSDSETDVSPDPELKASISSTNPGFGETVTVSGSIENIDEQRTVEVFFSGEKVAETTTSSSFSEQFRADKIGQNTVKVVSENLEKSFNINVQTTVEIVDINTNNYLSLGQQHQACVEIEASSPSTVSLYEDGNRIGEKIGQRAVCFDNSAPEQPGALEYRAVATAGDKTDEFTKRVPVVNLQQNQEEPRTATGGFFENNSNTVLSLLLLLVLIAAYYREKIKGYSVGLIRP